MNERTALLPRHCSLQFVIAFVLISTTCGILITSKEVRAQSANSGIVISQIYGGGGNSGATLRNDFVELFNRSTQSVSITGWSVQYASASGTSWDRTVLSGTIQPGQYFLIQEAQGNAGSASLPAPDLSGGLNLSATDGKVVLLSNSTALSGSTPSGSTVVDFVGYGSANAAEGSPVTALGNTMAAIRQSSGCTDTNNNRSDFGVGLPTPHNSQSQVNLCNPVVQPPSKPDLIVTAATSPTGGTVGGTLAGTSATVKNQGASAAGGFRVGFYLSTTAGATASAVYTGASCSVGTGLAVGGVFNCSSSINIPVTLKPGAWYLLAIADDQSQIDESDESNNYRASDGGAISVTSPSGNGAQCGVERWAVKTGTDADANLVNLNNITSTTISALSVLPSPANKPDNNRVSPTETTVFVLNATLSEYKLEDDSDYHVVLQDSGGKTMIAEIPLPTCVGPGSPFLSSIIDARSAFNARLTATTSFKTANIPVQIKGVGFFDSLHGQTGVAPNGIELHPVLDINFDPAPVITSVNTAGGAQGIAQNDWIEIKGKNLAPATVGPAGMTWSNAPEFAAGTMPTELKSVSVKVNGKAAYVYYLSPTQINALTPLDRTQEQASIVATVGGNSTSTFNVSGRTVAPSFLLFGATSYVVATHADGSLLGPPALSVPGYSFTPAQPGETIILYGVGFGLPSTPLTEGSATQFGILPTSPSVQIGNSPAVVQFAGLISAGLYQFNVVVPTSTAIGDSAITANYGGTTTSASTLISVQR